eukprot:403366627
MTKECQWCGYGCQSCNIITGCEICPGENQQKGLSRVQADIYQPQYLNTQFSICNQPLTTSDYSSDINCELFDFSDSINCLKCKPGYFLDSNFYNSTAARFQSYYVDGEICLDALGQYECLNCAYGYSIVEINSQKRCYWRYGETIYSMRGMVESSTCIDCDSSCFECAGSGQNQCLSCNSGYYLHKDDRSISYGSCVLKENQQNFTIYVKSVKEYQVDNPPSEISGSQDYPLYSIQDALLLAEDLGAPYLECHIDILLINTYYLPHFMLKKYPFQEYQPLKRDQYSQTTRINIMPDQQNQFVTINFKLRDTFKFKVGPGFSLKWIQFDAVDSLIDEKDDFPLFNCSSDYTQNCCQIVQNNMIGYMINGKSVCKLRHQPTDVCLIPFGGSFIEFDINKNTMMTQYVYFKNFLYEFNSLIQVNEFGGNISMTNVQFDNINSCGSIIGNKQPIAILKNDADQSSITATFLQRQSNIQTSQLSSIRTNLLPYFDPFNQSCSLQDTTQQPCFGLNLTQVRVYKTGMFKKTQSETISVDPTYQMQFTGQFIDLNSFRGPIQISSGYFKDNFIAYKDCEISVQLFRNQFPSQDWYPSLGIKQKLQLRSFISIVNHGQYKININQNQFFRNSASNGLIFLDLLDRGSDTSSRVAIYDNQFQYTAGLLDSQIIRVKMRSTGIFPTQYIVNEQTSLCHGLLIAYNQIQYSFGCAGFQEGAIKIMCRPTQDFAYMPNDQETGFDTQINSYFANQRSLVNYDQSQYSNTLLDTDSGYLFDFNSLSLIGNSYYYNTVSKQSGVVNILNVPKIQIQDEKFEGSQDKNINPQDYSSALRQIYLRTSVNEYTLDQVSDYENFNQQLLACCNVKVMGAQYLNFKNNQLLYNSLIQPTYSTLRSEFLYLENHYGYYDYFNISVFNHYGVQSQIDRFGLTLDYIPRYPYSILPLVRYGSSTNVKTNGYDYISGIYSNVKYGMVDINTDSDFFSTYIPELLLQGTQSLQSFLNIEITNFDCISCTRPLFHTNAYQIMFLYFKAQNVSMIRSWEDSQNSIVGSGCLVSMQNLQQNVSMLFQTFEFSNLILRQCSLFDIRTVESTSVILYGFQIDQFDTDYTPGLFNLSGQISNMFSIGTQSSFINLTSTGSSVLAKLVSQNKNTVEFVQAPQLNTISQDNPYENGGIVCMISSVNKLVFQSGFTIYQTTTSAFGGIFYMEGFDNIIEAKYFSLIYFNHQNNAGFLGVKSSNYTSFITSNGFYLNQLNSQGNGSFLHVESQTTDILLQYAQISSLIGTGEGALIYLTGIKDVENKGLLLSDSQANIQLMYLITNTIDKISSIAQYMYTKVADLSFSMKYIQIRCSSNEISREDLRYAISNYLMQGASLFKFDNNKSKVDSQYNTIQNCNYGSQGAIYNFENTEFTDSNSSYNKISARSGGIIDTQHSYLTLNNLEIKELNAFQGAGFKLGINVTLIINNATISDIESYQGGLIHSQGHYQMTQYETNIIFTGIIEISNVYTQIYGGLVYAFSLNQNIDFSNVIIKATNLSSEQYAALLYYNSNLNLTVQNIDINSLLCRQNGCFLRVLRSQFVTIQNLKINCYNESINNVFQILTQDEFSQQNNPSDNTQYLGSAFQFIGQKEVTSINNSISSCKYNYRGGAFDLYQTNFIDYNSKFTDNAAYQGGVVYSQQSNVTFFDSKFYNSQSQNGGGIFYQGNGHTLVFTNVLIQDSISYGDGGFLYFNNQDYYEQLDKNSYTIFNGTNLINNTKASLQGGFLYCNEYDMNIHFTGQTTISNSEVVNGYGGFIYMLQAKYLLLDGLVVNKVYATMSRSGSFLFSATYAVTIQILNCNFTQNEEQFQLKSIYNYRNIIENPPQDAETAKELNINGNLFTISIANYVESFNNRFKGLYFGQNSSVFHLSQVQNFNDSLSHYENIAALRSPTLYCIQCHNINIQDNYYVNLTSYFDGGAIGIFDSREGNIQINKTTFINSQSVLNGGAIYVTFKVFEVSTCYKGYNFLLRYITAINCSSQGGSGGFLYFYENQFQLDIYDSTFQNVVANQQGGVIHSHAALFINMGNLTSTGQNAYTQGSFFYFYQQSTICNHALIFMQDNRHDCTSKNIISPLYYIDSAYAVESKNQTVTNCGQPSQAIVFSIQAVYNFTDFNSNYQNLTGITEGIYYASGTTLITLDNNTYREITCQRACLANVDYSTSQIFIYNVTVENIYLTSENRGGLIAVTISLSFEPFAAMNI